MLLRISGPIAPARNYSGSPGLLYRTHRRADRVSGYEAIRTYSPNFSISILNFCDEASLTRVLLDVFPLFLRRLIVKPATVISNLPPLIFQLPSCPSLPLTDLSARTSRVRGGSSNEGNQCANLRVNCCGLRAE